ncbi:hypothetical protein ABTN10_19470, partial [Acinetobacter baumannii]
GSTNNPGCRWRRDLFDGATAQILPLGCWSFFRSASAMRSVQELSVATGLLSEPLGEDPTRQ